MRDVVQLGLRCGLAKWLARLPAAGYGLSFDSRLGTRGGLFAEPQPWGYKEMSSIWVDQ
jgi:hypothetical protein